MGKQSTFAKGYVTLFQPAGGAGHDVFRLQHEKKNLQPEPEPSICYNFKLLRHINRDESNNPSKENFHSCNVRVGRLYFIS